MAIQAPFDRLRYDEDYGHYAKTLKHKGHKISIHFLAENDEELQLLIPSAIKLWKERIHWFKVFREYAAIELLGELNDTLDCGQDHFKPVTAAQVRKILPAPFQVEFTADYDDTDDIYFEMAGGEDEEVLDECVFQVSGTLKNGIVDGSVDSLL